MDIAEKISAMETANFSEIRQLRATLTQPKLPETR